MPGSESKLLILGLGNLLCTDDGVGPVVAQAIAGSREVPDGVQVLDGGTLAILVDAIEIDAAPGTLVRLEGDEVGPAVAARLSVHQVGVSDLIEAARWRERIPPTLILHGVVPESTELGVELSPRVQAALPALIDRVLLEAQRLGFFLPVTRGSDVAPAHPALAGDAARRLLAS
jgi:hydrogenase maturation protease